MFPNNNSELDIKDEQIISNNGIIFIQNIIYIILLIIMMINHQNNWIQKLLTKILYPNGHHPVLYYRQASEENIENGNENLISNITDIDSLANNLIRLINNIKINLD